MLFYLGTPIRLLLGVLFYVIGAIGGLPGKINWKKLITKGMDEGMEV